MFVIAFLHNLPEAWLCICMNLIQPSQHWRHQNKYLTSQPSRA